MVKTRYKHQIVHETPKNYIMWIYKNKILPKKKLGNWSKQEIAPFAASTVQIGCGFSKWSNVDPIDLYILVRSDLLQKKHLRIP